MQIRWLINATDQNYPITLNSSPVQIIESGINCSKRLYEWTSLLVNKPWQQFVAKLITEWNKPILIFMSIGELVNLISDCPELMR